MNVASRHGFYFHHAHRSENYVLMCLWLDNTSTDTLPAYPDHFVGVGGMLINDQLEILLIQETRGTGAADQKPWKLPGGFMDPQETIRQAVEREVMEETGIKGEF